MSSSRTPQEPNAAPYLRIAQDLRRRITEGELADGDRVPSTRALVREWGVAMATASKALAVLRDQGWVRTEPGSGTIVRARSGPATHAHSGAAGSSLSSEIIVRAAIALADAEGQKAVSVRRVAAELGVGAMSLYRHVPDKDELLRLMADVAFGAEPFPVPPPRGWRARLDHAAHLQWRAYQRHPWLAPTLLNTLVRPPAVISGARLLDWSLRALRDLGLDARTKFTIIMALNGYVGGIALTRSLGIEYHRETGMTGAQRSQSDLFRIADVLRSGEFSEFLRATGEAPDDLDEVFEFGLQRHLDGIAAFLARRR